jgi:hypothetical protein
MRAALSCVAIFVALPVSADSNIGKLGQINEDLVERGLTPAHVTIEYSLTDNCGLNGLHVVENSHPGVLGPEVVEEVVKVMIGPFSGSTPSGELIQFSTGTESPPKKLSMTTRMFSWNTSDGHRYVVCRFFFDGELESVRLIDGEGNQYEKKIKDRIIDHPLSELEPKRMRASFESEDQWGR